MIYGRIVDENKSWYNYHSNGSIETLDKINQKMYVSDLESGENMTFEEFEQILKKEKIPREWFSLNETYAAPVVLLGKTLHYGKHGRLDFLDDIKYDIILEKLREYKAEFEFVQSNEIAQITYIEVVSSEHIKEYGNVFVVSRESFKSDKDTALLKEGFKFKGYDQYMAYYRYQKVCGDEIFTGVEIGLKLKTQDFERRQFGFKDVVMNSSVTLPFITKLREKIVEYVKEKKTQKISKEDNLFQEIIDEYGFKNIIEEENKRIEFLDEVYKNILGYELERQKLLRQYSEEKLLEVYRKIKMDSLFSSITMSSRPYCIQNLRLLEAKMVLNELIEKG